jgi:hypothetical protein
MAEIKKFLSLERLSEYDALLKAKIAQDDAAILDSAKDYVDGLIDGVNTSITNITNGDVVVKEAEHADSATTATQDGNGKVIADTYETKTDAEAKLTESKEYTDEEVGKIKTYVGTIPATATATDIVGYVQEKTAGIATEGAMTELGNRVGVVEGKVATIEGDYLKSSDKTELQGNIDTVASAVELLTNGVNPETVDGVNDLIEYVNEHGAEVTGIRADIKANADAIAAIPQADWNQNDSTAADFIKNRTHYADETRAELAAEKTIDCSEKYGDGYLYTDYNSFQIRYNIKYLVVWDGVEYYCESRGGYLCAGDNGLSADAPFIVSEGSMGAMKYTALTEGEHTVAIYTVESTIKQLDEKFIPDTIARATDLLALDGRITTSEADIDALEAKVGDKTVSEQIEAAVTEVKNDSSNKDAVVLAEAQKGIAAVQTALDTHTGNADIHVTAADKVKWNAAADVTAKAHEHSNFEVLEGITAAKVAAWDAAEGNAKTHANGLNTAMDTRVTAIETWHANFVEVSEEEINALFA